MEVLDIIYSATIRDTEHTKVVVNTIFFGGTYTWYAKRLNYQNDALLEEIECDPASLWLNPQDALDAGVVYVMGGEEPDDTGTFTGGIDPDAYPLPDEIDGQAAYDAYDRLPTGWDAQDHKALYE